MEQCFPRGVASLLTGKVLKNPCPNTTLANDIKRHSKLYIKRVAAFAEQNHHHPNSAQLCQDTRTLITQLTVNQEQLDDGQHGIDHRGYEGIDESL